MGETARIPPSRVIIFYHRPPEDLFHGSSVYFTGFVDTLRSHLPLIVVAPRLRSKPTANAGEKSQVRMAGLQYLIATSFAAARFLFADSRRSDAERARVLVAFDVYVAGVAAIWARIRGCFLVYYPLDSNRVVSQYWREARYKGARFFRAFRTPLEWSGLRAADLILVPSESMRTELLSQGLPSDRVRICPLKRKLPPYVTKDVVEWTGKLGLRDRTGVVFVGSFQYGPNVRAFEFLRERVAPALLSKCPDALLLVAGRNSEAYAEGLPPNMKVLGTVRDLDGLLYACSIGLAPMDVLGGTSVKVIDYRLHGLRVIATPEAAAGVSGSEGMIVAPLRDFESTVISQVRRSGPRQNLEQPPVADMDYVRLYTLTQDIEEISREILEHARD
jgi:glycosyl transferase family 1/glycosyl transferase family 4